MDITLEKGLTGRAGKVVAYQDTAGAVASGLAEVFSTPMMIAMMEQAAFTAVQPRLPKGASTVGVSIDAKHLAATPVGLKVWAEATLVGADGRRLVFDISAYDEAEKIGEARHVRFIVDSEKFLKKANAKAGNG